MLAFPPSTEIKKIIPKESLLGAIGPMPSATAAQKRMFNGDVYQMTLVNDVRPERMNLAPGRQVRQFFVVRVALQQRTFDVRSLELLVGRIAQPQMLLALCHQGQCLLAAKAGREGKLVLGRDWRPEDGLKLTFSGLDMDSLWFGIVRQVAGNPWKDELDIDGNLKRREQMAALELKIQRLEKKCRQENQPSRRIGLFEEIQNLRNELTHL